MSRDWPRPYVPAKPTTITIDLGTVDSASQFMGRPGVEIVGTGRGIHAYGKVARRWRNLTISDPVIEDYTCEVVEGDDSRRAS